ncbi:phosphotransferase family protein [Marinicella sp. W31]|uniref:phosphotransferase family protein n=1 Tax=Marinicella sp. W31 TaxID=3023713 RepID=UPI00375792BB
MSKDTSQAHTPRTEDQLDQEKLNTYLHQHVEGMHINSIKQFSGGASNLTYLLETDTEDIILRTAPAGTKAKGAHNMQREFDILSQVHYSFELCPKVIHMCTDSHIIGREFYLMEYLQGHIIRNQLPSLYTAQDCPQLCSELVTVLHRLHNSDISQLQAFNKGSGYIERQIGGWSKRFQNAHTDDVPHCEAIMQWLQKNQPRDHNTYTLIHNDYKFDNLLFGTDDPQRIVGVLDWEMATIGDPLMDLGCSLAYWVQADDPEAMHMLKMMPTDHAGMYTRDQLVHAYASSAGIALDDYRFYYVFGLFRLAVIIQQIYYRFYHGQTSNPRFAPFGKIAAILIHQAQENMK